MYLVMAQAFVNAMLAIGNADISTKHGKFQAGWNAKLSYRTHRALVDAGYTKFHS